MLDGRMGEADEGSEGLLASPASPVPAFLSLYGYSYLWELPSQKTKKTGDGSAKKESEY
ncbi:MAG: hypothetical protein AB1330_02595 [Bacillota bacterium]